MRIPGFLVGIAALLGAGLALVFLWTAPGPSPTAIASPAAPVAEAAAPSASGVAPAPALPAIARPPAAAGQPATDPLAMARARREAIARSPIPVADRVTRRALRQALFAPRVQSRLERCVERDGGFGAGEDPAPRSAPAVLVLHLEPRGGRLLVGDVQVRDFGGASAEAVACAQDALRGLAAAAPARGTAQRSFMEFPLSPRSGALARSMNDASRRRR